MNCHERWTWEFMRDGPLIIWYVWHLQYSVRTRGLYWIFLRCCEYEIFLYFADIRALPAPKDCAVRHENPRWLSTILLCAFFSINNFLLETFFVFGDYQQFFYFHIYYQCFFCYKYFCVRWLSTILLFAFFFINIFLL